MMGVGRCLCLLLAYLAADGIIQKEVKLDGEVGLDCVCAVASAMERRFAPFVLLP